MAKELLKDVTIRNAKPTDKTQRLNDGDGLYLLIKPDGAKWWRLDYTIKLKRKTLSLGVYPVTGLADARDKAREAKKDIDKGIDPSDKRKAERAEDQLAIENEQRIKAGLPVMGSFQQFALEWLISDSLKKTAEKTKIDRLSRFNKYVFPVIGNMPIKEVKASHVINVIKPIVAKGTLGVARRLQADISSIFCDAIANERVEYDPSYAVKKIIPSIKAEPRAAITDPKQVGKLLRDIYNYQGTFVVQMAFRLSPLVFMRPGEIRQMLWADVDLDAKEWRPYVSKTKVLHIVPLSTQAIAILEALKPVTGRGKYVFSSIRTDARPMSSGTIGTALKALGYDSNQIVPHGFRAMASTILNEQGWNPDAIERALCHMPRDQVRAAYNRAQYLEERRRMMQAWADYLDGLKNGAVMIPINAINAGS